jgi:5-methylcytosine-specific restriction endonuclease McrA
MARFHGSYAWKKLRKTVRIAAEHCCSRCGKFMPSGLHVHHQIPIAKTLAVALEPLNCSTACPECHNRIEPRSGVPRLRSGCDESGHPLSPDHPWNKVKL